MFQAGRVDLRAVRTASGSRLALQLIWQENTNLSWFICEPSLTGTSKQEVDFVTSVAAHKHAGTQTRTTDAAATAHMAPSVTAGAISSRQAHLTCSGERAAARKRLESGPQRSSTSAEVEMFPDTDEI